MKEIEIISKKYGKHFVLIDDDDYDKVNKYKWVISKRDKEKYYCIAHVYKGNYKYGKIYLHRYILDFPYRKYIDHINGNGLDNRKINMRICSNAENCRNCIKSVKGSSSIYKGVVFDKRRSKYYAQIMFNYKNIFLGYHETQEKAALAYNNAAPKYFGEFANLNIIGI